MTSTDLVHVPRPEDDPEQRDPNAGTPRAARAARKVAIGQRRSEVAALVLSKIPQREIARRLHVGLGTVGDDVKAIKGMWADRAAESYDAHVAEELAKLDWLERAFLPGAFTGDVKSAEMLLKVMDRKARLLGLDQPTQAKVTIDVVDVEAQKARAREQLEQVRSLRAV